MFAPLPLFAYNQRIKSEKSCRYKIFRSRALCRETAQSSAGPIGENTNFKVLIRKTLKCVFLLGAALRAACLGRDTIIVLNLFVPAAAQIT